jgi:hypothetical protein
LELGMPEFTVYKDRYIWNNEKNELNEKKYGISFEEAVGVFDEPGIDINNSRVLVGFLDDEPKESKLMDLFKIKTNQ